MLCYYMMHITYRKLYDYEKGVMIYNVKYNMEEMESFNNAAMKLAVYF